MASYTMRPNATIANAWTLVNAATAHEALDDPVTQPTAGSEADGYLTTTGNNSTVDVELDGPTDVDTATDLTAWFEGWTDSDEAILVDIRDSAGVVLGSQTVSPGTTYSWISVTLTGQSWTQTDIDGMRIAFTGSKVGGGPMGELRVRAAYAELTYSERIAGSVSGTIAQTLPSLTQNAAGSISPPGITGTAAQTLPALTQSLSGSVAAAPPPTPSGVTVTVDGTTLIFDNYEVT